MSLRVLARHRVSSIAHNSVASSNSFLNRPQYEKPSSRFEQVVFDLRTVTMKTDHYETGSGSSDGGLQQRHVKSLFSRVWVISDRDRLHMVADGEEDLSCPSLNSQWKKKRAMKP